MYFRIIEFEVDVNDSIFSGNELHVVYRVHSQDSRQWWVYIATFYAIIFLSLSFLQI